MTATAPVRPRQEPRATDFLEELFAGTPGKFRIFGAVAVVACLAFGGFGFWIVTNLNNALRNERDHAAQLVRIQTIRTSLVKADAAATNAFLVGGGEPADARQTYVTSIANAAATITEAANGDDDVKLEEVNQLLTRYTGLIESARANNRQNFPIGAAYLRQASRTIRDDALPKLEDLVTTERSRVDDSSNSVANAQDLFLLLLLVLVASLLVTQVYLYRKTHRVLNKPLVLATSMVVASGLFALALIDWVRDREDKAREGPYAQTVALATARIDAFDAKSAESLYLIARGSGQAYEDRAQKVAADGRSALQIAKNRQTVIEFDQFLAQHRTVIQTDVKGNHDAAVALATGGGAANMAFARFDAVSARALEAEANDLADDLSAARRPLLFLALLLLVVGLLSALASRRGIAQRLQEYR